MNVKQATKTRNRERERVWRNHPKKKCVMYERESIGERERVMGNMYDNTCSPSSSSCQLLSSSSRAGVSASSQQDELSLFLHQILLRSSSSPASSSSSFMSSQFRPESSHLPPSRPVLVSGEESSSRGVIFSDSGDYFPGNVSSSVGAFENNDLDDYDCESEEGLEALVEGVAVKPVSARNSSKRTRAAEVHNLSEKRRRSRINEKMKALQKLIPNSNKTDKASMLDEAIEYLKQLQLQVQMLSMRSGLSLRPMCLPGVLQPLQLSQMRMSFGEGNSSFHMNMIDTLPMNQETATQNAYSLPNQCFPSNLPSIPNTTQIINPETSLGLESFIHDHFETFQLHRSSDKVRREDMLPHQQLDVTHSKTTNPLVSLPFGTEASIPNHNAPLEPCIIGRELPEGVLLKNIEQNQIISSNSFNSMYGKRRAMRDDLKTEGP